MPHHLLIADDSVTIQRVIKLTFADEDIDVVAVGDGSQALAAIDQAPPDIVLADVEMPGCNGYEVARHVRNSPRLAHIPVVLLTGAFEPVDEAKAAAVGCDGVLSKPFEPQAVLARVRELLAKPRAVASPPVSAPPAIPVPPHLAPEPMGVSSVAVASVEPPKPPQDLDAYFQRLDQAFADLATTPRPSTLVEASPVPVTGPNKGLDAMVATFGTDPGPSVAPPEAAGPTTWPPAPLTFASPFLAKERPRDIEPLPAGPPAVLAPSDDRPTGELSEIVSTRSSRPGVRSLVEAFKGLIAEEQSAPAAPMDGYAVPQALASAAPSRFPAGPTVPASSLSDDVIDQIATRVIDRLAGEGNVKEIVSRIAEQLVRDEIDDIRRRL